MKIKKKLNTVIIYYKIYEEAGDKSDKKKQSSANVGRIWEKKFVSGKNGVWAFGCLQCIGVGACLDGTVPRWAGYAATPSAYWAPSVCASSVNGPSHSCGCFSNCAASTSKTLASPGEQVLGHLKPHIKQI